MIHSNDIFPTDSEWLWMTHPTRNEGKPIPVRIITDDEGYKWFIPFEEEGCEFEWSERDEDWRIVPAASQPAQPQADPSGEVLRLHTEMAGLRKMLDQANAILNALQDKLAANSCLQPVESGAGKKWELVPTEPTPAILAAAAIAILPAASQCGLRSRQDCGSLGNYGGG